MNKTLNYTFRVILSIAVITLTISANYELLNSKINDNSITKWIIDFCFNIGSGFLGSLVVIFVYDRVLQKEQERENLHRRRIALSVLNKILIRHLELLYDIAWCGGPEALRLEGHIRDLFDDQYFSQVNNLDPGEHSPLKVREYSMNRFADYLIEECKFFKSKTNEMLYKYQDVLDSKMVDILERINEQKFINYIFILAVSRLEWDRRCKKEEIEWGLSHVLKPHTELITQLTELYNSQSQEVDHITIEKIAEIKWFTPGDCRYILLGLSLEKQKEILGI